jgi:hypothetical protein
MPQPIANPTNVPPRDVRLQVHRCVAKTGRRLADDHQSIFDREHGLVILSERLGIQALCEALYVADVFEDVRKAADRIARRHE